MDRVELYKTIAERTGGDIYFGVVGSVRTGKSTFIRRFMELLVLPAIEDEYVRQRVSDELPQSGSGKSVMTTQPKFVPNDAVSITLPGDEPMDVSVRMVDCVGFMIPEAMGQSEGDIPRMVRTPWYDHEIPFEDAAEIGTTRVMTEHSTVGIVVTTDGSIAGIPRSAYIDAEERVIAKLKEQGKPFVIILNTTTPTSDDSLALRSALEDKYDTTTVVMDVLNMDAYDAAGLIEDILLEFPIRSISVTVPAWVRALGIENPLNAVVAERIRSATENVFRMRDAQIFLDNVGEIDRFLPMTRTATGLNTGSLEFSLLPLDCVFYEVLSEECGYTIEDDYHLIATLKEFVTAKTAYDRLKDALDDAQRTGYGLVPPKMEEMTLEEPEIVRQGSRFGVRLKANASGLHLIRVNVDSEIAPLVGTEEQSEELVKYLVDTFEQNPDMIWQTNIFGKPLYDLVCSGMMGKVNQMPDEVRMKLREAVQRIVNEGCSNLVCIML